MPRRLLHRARPRDQAMLVVGMLVVVGLAPLLPDATVAPDAFAPAAQEPRVLAATAGRGALTAAMRAEIERVVAEGEPARRPPGRRTESRTTAALVEAQVRCAMLEGQRYCLGVGWTTRTEEEVRARLRSAVLAARRTTSVETTGDLDALAILSTAAARPTAARASAERAELTQAARAVAKVWLLRHEIQGVPLPEGFFEAHPEARVDVRADTGVAGAPATAPAPQGKDGKGRIHRFSMLKDQRTNEQSRSYWCGPATMQMIAWGWQDVRRPQRLWADKLGTTTDGTALSEIVRQINRSTGYDRPDRAGPYVALDVSDFSFRQWMRLTKRHLAGYRAPVVLHPVLLERFFPYLDDDASGHFQVGRGYLSRPGRTKRISFFEPWNQQAFDPSEPYVERVQWRNAYKSYRANLAHFQQSIGV